MGEASWTIVELEKTAELLPGSSVLIPGCGLGEDAFYFSRLGYNVSAVDWAHTAVDDLRMRARRVQLSIEALCCSYWDIPENWYGTFDVFVEQTFFCVLEPEERFRYVQQVLNLIKPKGHFLGAFFVTEDPKKKSLRTEGAPPFWITETELRTLFDPHFHIVKLKDNFKAHPHRLELTGGNGGEWMAHFIRKKSLDSEIQTPGANILAVTDS